VPPAFARTTSEPTAHNDLEAAVMTPPQPEPVVVLRPPPVAPSPMTAAEPSLPPPGRPPVPAPRTAPKPEPLKIDMPVAQKPAPRRPMTAAEASLIGLLAPEPRARTLFGLRRR
jgi:hypothetical protein